MLYSTSIGSDSGNFWFVFVCICFGVGVGDVGSIYQGPLRVPTYRQVSEQVSEQRMDLGAVLSEWKGLWGKPQSSQQLWREQDKRWAPCDGHSAWVPPRGTSPNC